MRGLRIALSIKYFDGTNIGFCISEGKYELNELEDRSVICRFSTKMLAPGKYFMCVQLIYLDDLKGVHGLDQTDKIYFEVLDNTNVDFLWQRQFWGNVNFPVI